MFLSGLLIAFVLIKNDSTKTEINCVGKAS